MKPRASLFAVALLVAGTSCGHPPSATGPLYEVVAPLLSVKGGPPTACNLILLSLPPAGCGGVQVESVDIARIAGVHRYPNGTMETPPLKLVGTWHDLVLTLTQSVQPGSYPATKTPAPCPPQSSGRESQLLALEQQIVHDEAAQRQHGVLVLEVGICGDALSVLVAVADSPTISYLTNRYDSIDVTGWLSPA
jgi:hypothetical protein